MKRILSLLLAVVLMITACPVAFAADNIVDSLEYKIEDGEVKITDCLQSVSGEVVIPEKIKGYPVTEIGYSAFASCNKIEKITLPDSARVIGQYCFQGCSALKEITLSCNLNEIGFGAFFGCKKLYGFNISTDNKYFSVDSNGVLFNKDKSVLVQFPAGSSLTAYSLPDSVFKIERYSFYGCEKIKSITFNAGILKIDASAFSGCTSLADVSYKAPERVSAGEVYIDGDAFEYTPYYSACLRSDGFAITPEGVWLRANTENSSVTELVIPTDVKYVASQAFYYADYPNVKKIVFSGDVVVEASGIFEYGDFVDDPAPGESYIKYDIETVVFNGSCFLKDGALYCPGLKSLIFNDDVSCIGDICNSNDITVERNYRKELNYNITDNNGQKHGVVTKKGIAVDETFTPSYSYMYSEGNYENSAVKFFAATDGTIYALYGFENKVSLFSPEKTQAVATITKTGYKCAAGTIGEDDYLYLLWVKNSSDEEYQSAPDTVNIVISKYSLDGKNVGNCELPVSLTESIQPLAAGNAAIAYKNGTIGVAWNTLWTKAYDGLNHQGAEFAAVDAKTMTLVDFYSNICSHSFGIVMRASEYGFEIINNGDANPRGVNLNSYTIGTYMSDTCIFFAPGQYGSNGAHLDGNATYVTLGGFTSSESTYALAGTAERIFTSDIYYESGYKTGNYDVFVRIIDETMEDSAATDCAGEDRINKANGAVIDTNVIWLTSYDETKKADGVKVITLESGAYCVLWNEYHAVRPYEWEFDGIHYVILDEKGYTLRKETVMYGGALNETNLMPIVDGTILSWVTYDSEEEKINWYTADIDTLYSEHTPEAVKGYDATCTETGLTDGAKCSVCGKILTEQQEIAEKGHTPEIIKGYAATCTQKGLSDGSKCSVCGTILEKQYIIYEKEHTPETVKGYDSTCTEPGLSDGKKCSVCDAVIQAQIKIPADGHYKTTIYGYDSTCTETGLTDGTECSVCGEVLKKQQTIPLKAHTPETVKGYAATCTQKGLSDGSKCSVCGEVLKKQQTIPLKDHTPETVKGYAATCTKTGLTDGTECSVCGEVLKKQQTIPLKAHTPETVKGYAATCTKTGLTDGTECSVCGKTLSEQAFTDPTGHTFGSWYVSRKPSPTATGEERRKCSVCGHEEKRAIAASSYKTGDADNDGNITATDARLALRCSVFLEKFTPGSAQYNACDVDKDGSVTASDARFILRAAVGLEDTSNWA